MKNVTATSELRIKKLVKSGNPFGMALELLLTKMKQDCSCDGYSISALRNLGLYIPNSITFEHYETQELCAMSILYPEYFNYSSTLDLKNVTIRDFNALVKIIYFKAEQPTTQEVNSDISNYYPSEILKKNPGKSTDSPIIIRSTTQGGAQEKLYNLVNGINAQPIPINMAAVDKIFHGYVDTDSIHDNIIPIAENYPYHTRQGQLYITPHKWGFELNFRLKCVKIKTLKSCILKFLPENLKYEEITYNQKIHRDGNVLFCNIKIDQCMNSFSKFTSDPRFIYGMKKIELVGNVLEVREMRKYPEKFEDNTLNFIYTDEKVYIHANCTSIYKPKLKTMLQDTLPAFFDDFILGITIEKSGERTEFTRSFPYDGNYKLIAILNARGFAARGIIESIKEKFDVKSYNSFRDFQLYLEKFILNLKANFEWFKPPMRLPIDLLYYCNENLSSECSDDKKMVYKSVINFISYSYIVNADKFVDIYRLENIFTELSDNPSYMAFYYEFKSGFIIMKDIITEIPGYEFIGSIKYLDYENFEHFLRRFRARLIEYRDRYLLRKDF